MSNESEDRAISARLVDRLLESAGKQGVYYVVRFPFRCRLYAFPWEDFGDLWHGDAWRRFVAQELAENWANATASVTAEGLKPWWKGFPRGRVERTGPGEYVIFHADDLGQTGIARERIAQAFELGNSKMTWSADPHEQQNPEHTEALKRLLRF